MKRNKQKTGEQEIVGSYKKGILKLVIFFLPLIVIFMAISSFGKGPPPWASMKPVLFGISFYYALLSGYISFNPKWVWDISYFRLRLSAVKPEPTKFYFTAVRISMLITMIISLSLAIFLAVFL